jgi:hypothetical protein
VSVSPTEVAAARLLGHCLSWLRPYTRGIPQNNDHSSFLGNFYLSNLDNCADGVRGDYFRYSDDIRLVVKTRADAIDGFQIIQSQLRAMGLFLNSAKTRLLQPGTDDWTAALDSSRDAILSEIDDLLEIGNVAADRRAASLIMAGLLRANAPSDFRAFGNRAIRGRRTARLAKLMDTLAMKGFFRMPECADLWSRMLSLDDADGKIGGLLAMLSSPDYNRNAWVNCRAIDWIGRSETNSGAAVDWLRTIAQEPERNSMERSSAVLALGNLGVFDANLALGLLSEIPSEHVGRQMVFAFRDAPTNSRHKVWRRAKPIGSVVSSLIRWLDRGREKPSADETAASEPSERPILVGRVNGRATHYRRPVATADYE